MVFHSCWSWSPPVGYGNKHHINFCWLFNKPLVFFIMLFITSLVVHTNAVGISLAGDIWWLYTTCWGLFPPQFPALAWCFLFFIFIFTSLNYQVLSILSVMNTVELIHLVSVTRCCRWLVLFGWSPHYQLLLVGWLVQVEVACLVACLLDWLLVCLLGWSIDWLVQFQVGSSWSPWPGVEVPHLGMDEAYHLHLDGTSATRLTAQTLHGLRRGMETLLQVMESWMARWLVGSPRRNS